MNPKRPESGREGPTKRPCRTRNWRSVGIEIIRSCLAAFDKRCRLDEEENRNLDIINNPEGPKKVHGGCVKHILLSRYKPFCIPQVYPTPIDIPRERKAWCTQ